jgi:dual specificity phosphatase 12
VNIAGASNIKSISSRLMDALISSLNNMVSSFLFLRTVASCLCVNFIQLILCGLKEMETSQTSELVTQQKPGPEVNQNHVENDFNPEKETGELPGSKVSEEPVETCQDTVVETDIIPEKKAEPEAGLEVNQKPTETWQEKSAESDVNREKQAPDPGIIYRCKKCRRMLATQEFVVTHEVGAGGKSFNRGKQSDDDDKQTECPCIFVEPMKWMQTGKFSIYDGFTSLLLEHSS